MPQVYVFADESGNLDFSPTGTRYFVLTTVTAESCDVGDALLQVRRTLARTGIGLNEELHCAENSLAVRKPVFETIRGLNFRVDATIIEKCQVHPAYRPTEARFYHFAWYEHMRRIITDIVTDEDKLLVIAAALYTKRVREEFWRGVTDAVSWLVPKVERRVAFWAAGGDPCLQLADYCAWAVFRKWERSDTAYHEYIADKLVTETLHFRPEEAVYYAYEKKGGSQLASNTGRAQGLLSSTTRLSSNIYHASGIRDTAAMIA